MWRPDRPAALLALMAILGTAAAARGQTTVAAARPAHATSARSGPGNKANPARAAATPEVKLIFDREVFSYPTGNRRDPFKPLTGREGMGPLFKDLHLRMIIASRDPAQSVGLLTDSNMKIYRVHRGDVVGSARVLEITATRIVFSVNEFGITRTEVLDLKPKDKEGQSR